MKNYPSNTSTRDAVTNFIAQLEAVNLTGLAADDVVVDGQIHRFRPGWEPKASKKRAWYIAFYFKTNSGDEFITGSYGWFKGADSYAYNVELQPDWKLSAIEKKRIDQEQTESRRKADQLRQNESKATAEKALSIWNGCSVDGHSPYLQRKNIAGVSCRYSRGSIVLPVEDFDSKLHGLQFIDASGEKRFLTGTVKKGHFCRLGIVADAFGFVGIAEGYATGVSCHMATQFAVFVAFDAGNLEPVARAVREQWPNIKIIIFADDDFDNPDNPGRTKAEYAARVVGGIVLLPPVAEVA